MEKKDAVLKLVLMFFGVIIVIFMALCLLTVKTDLNFILFLLIVCVSAFIWCLALYKISGSRAHNLKRWKK